MKKYFSSLLVIASALLFATVVILNNQTNSSNIFAAECDHVGYHYEHQDPTETECGWNEYWVCCKCHRSFTVKPAGSFTDQDASKMIGKPDPSMIGIYLAPLNGGSDGDYYVSDPFDE